VSNGTPLTLSFPSERSKYSSELSDRNTLRIGLTGSLGAMRREKQREEVDYIAKLE
jgi:hypothetical protein